MTSLSFTLPEYLPENKHIRVCIDDRIASDIAAHNGAFDGDDDDENTRPITLIEKLCAMMENGIDDDDFDPEAVYRVIKEHIRVDMVEFREKQAAADASAQRSKKRKRHESAAAAGTLPLDPLDPLEQPIIEPILNIQSPAIDALSYVASYNDRLRSACLAELSVHDSSAAAAAAAAAAADFSTLPHHIILHILDWIEMCADFSTIEQFVGFFKNDIDRRQMLMFRSIRLAVTLFYPKLKHIIFGVLAMSQIRYLHLTLYTVLQRTAFDMFSQQLMPHLVAVRLKVHPSDMQDEFYVFDNQHLCNKVISADLISDGAFEDGNREVKWLLEKCPNLTYLQRGHTSTPMDNEVIELLASNTKLRKLPFMGLTQLQVDLFLRRRLELGGGIDQYEVFLDAPQDFTKERAALLGRCGIQDLVLLGSVPTLYPELGCLRSLNLGLYPSKDAIENLHYVPLLEKLTLYGYDDELPLEPILNLPVLKRLHLDNACFRQYNIEDLLSFIKRIAHKGMLKHFEIHLPEACVTDELFKEWLDPDVCKLESLVLKLICRNGFDDASVVKMTDKSALAAALHPTLRYLEIVYYDVLEPRNYRRTLFKNTPKDGNLFDNIEIRVRGARNLV